MHNQERNLHHIYFQTYRAFSSYRWSICNQRLESRRCLASSRWGVHMASSWGVGGDTPGWTHGMPCWLLPPKISRTCHSHPTLLLLEWSMSYPFSPLLHFVEESREMTSVFVSPSFYRNHGTVWRWTHHHCLFLRFQCWKVGTDMRLCLILGTNNMFSIVTAISFPSWSEMMSLTGSCPATSTCFPSATIT